MGTQLDLFKSEKRIRWDSQCGKIMRHLAGGFSLNQETALKLYGIRRLASRIHDLTKIGHTFVKLTDKYGNVSYKLPNAPYIPEGNRVTITGNLNVEQVMKAVDELFPPKGDQ